MGFKKLSLIWTVLEMLLRINSAVCDLIIMHKQTSNITKTK